MKKKVSRKLTVTQFPNSPAESMNLRVLVEVVAVLADPLELGEDPAVVHAPALQVLVIALALGRPGHSRGSSLLFEQVVQLHLQLGLLHGLELSPQPLLLGLLGAGSEEREGIAGLEAVA